MVLTAFIRTMTTPSSEAESASHNDEDRNRMKLAFVPGPCVHYERRQRQVILKRVRRAPTIPATRVATGRTRCLTFRRARLDAHRNLRGQVTMSMSGNLSSSTNNNNPSRNNRGDDNQSHDGGAWEGTTDHGVGEQQGESTDSTNARNTDNADQSPPQSTEFKFNQEILRRRMAALNKSNSKKSEIIIDFATLADMQSQQQLHGANGVDGDGEDDDAEAWISQDSLHADETAEVLKVFEKLDHVWVILFTNARDGTEGIYSLSIGNDNIVLAFQERYEAQRYAVCLEAQKFPQPQICEIDPKEIRKFCTDDGLKLGFIPKGMIISPPDESAIDDLDTWRGKPTSEESLGMTEQDIDAVRKRLDSLYGQ